MEWGFSLTPDFFRKISCAQHPMGSSQVDLPSLTRQTNDPWEQNGPESDPSNRARVPYQEKKRSVHAAQHQYGWIEVFAAGRTADLLGEAKLGQTVNGNLGRDREEE